MGASRRRSRVDIIAEPPAGDGGRNAQPGGKPGHLYYPQIPKEEATMRIVLYRSKEYYELKARGWQMVSLNTTWQAEMMPREKR